jgi:hypothetical protein
MAQLKAWHVLAGTHLAAGITGWSLAPRELLESEVTTAGFFTTDRKRVLSAAVASLRAEHSMVAYRFKTSAAVSVERDGFLMFDGHQDLIVPASIQLMVDLSKLSTRDVTFDEAAKLVTVQLPPLTMGDVAFEPEGARTINGGLLTFSQAQVDELTKANFASARRAVVKLANDPTIVEIAKRQARKNVERQFRMALEIAGRSDVRVAASFRGG